VLCILSLLLFGGHAFPQALAAPSATASDDAEAEGWSAVFLTNGAVPAGVAPLARGFNFSLTTTSQADAISGWSSLVTPTASYRFNKFVSFDSSVPVYTYIIIDVNKGTKAEPVYQYATKHGVLGDTALAGHVDFYPKLFDYTITATLGLPTGKPGYGLGAGRVTYNLNNHFEKSAGIFTPDVELGIGDSSNLAQTGVHKNYTAIGTLANFQAGTSVGLPLNLEFEFDAYEQLPLSTSIVYSTTGKGKKKITTAINTGPAEDNGFLNSLDLPLTPHIAMSGFYNRSLRQHDSVVGFSLTFLLKAPPNPDQLVQ
jgi:hypothetical protein